MTREQRIIQRHLDRLHAWAEGRGVEVELAAGGDGTLEVSVLVPEGVGRAAAAELVAEVHRRIGDARRATGQAGLRLGGPVEYAEDLDP